MANTTFKQHSKSEWHNHNVGYPGDEGIKIGCLQRIADAVEGMQKPYLSLVADVEFYRRRCKEHQENNSRMARRIAALQGVITRMKKLKSK